MTCAFVLAAASGDARTALDPPRSLDCLDAADANDSGAVDISDAIHSISFSFLGGAPPPAPYPSCGPDPSEDLLGCELHATCP